MKLIDHIKKCQEYVDAYGEDVDIIVGMVEDRKFSSVEVSSLGDAYGNPIDTSYVTFECRGSI